MKNKRIAVISLLSIFVLFGVAYLTFFLTQKYFPNPGLRNRDHNPAQLELIKEENNLGSFLTHSIEFTNRGENIYCTADIKGANEIAINGFNMSGLKETGKMKKNNDGVYEYIFNFDYFDINSFTIKMSEISEVNSIKVYYIK